MRIKNKILWGLTENSDFRRGIMKKTIYRWDCLKRGLGQFADLKGGSAKKRGMVFLRGVPRCVTRGGEAEKDLPCPFSKVGKKCPNFSNKMPIVVI